MDKSTHEIREELEHHPISETLDEIYHLKGTAYHRSSNNSNNKSKSKGKLHSFFSPESSSTSEGSQFVIFSELQAFIISSSFVDTAIGVVFATFFAALMKSFIDELTGKSIIFQSQRIIIHSVFPSLANY